MPVRGIPNNPGGVNGFQGFGTEHPYGEITNQKRLAGGAMLAGGKIAAGPLGAPKRFQAQAKKPKPLPAPPSQGGIVGPLPPDVSPLGWPNVYPPGTIQNRIDFASLGRHPGASPLLRSLIAAL